jgi:hypothetical protein
MFGQILIDMKGMLDLGTNTRINLLEFLHQFAQSIFWQCLAFAPRVERFSFRLQRRPRRHRFDLCKKAVTPCQLLLGSVLTVGKARLHGLGLHRDRKATFAQTPATKAGHAKTLFSIS